MTADRKLPMISRTWFKEVASNAEQISFCGGTAVGCSFRSPDKETHNEDAAALIELSPNHGVLAVADGIGGQNAGDRAAKTAIQSIIDHCRKAEAGSRLRMHLLDAIESANRKILKWRLGAGATLVVAEYRDGSVRIIHVGDAGAIVCSNRGKLKFMAVAHAPIAMAVEIGFLNEPEALVHEDRNIITNCVGAADMKIEIGPRLKMAARDTLVLASDGLFDNLTSEEITGSIRAGQFTTQAGHLVELSRSRMIDENGSIGKADDLTILCFANQIAADNQFDCQRLLNPLSVVKENLVQPFGVMNSSLPVKLLKSTLPN